MAIKRRQIEEPRLQPVARPVNTYVRPEAPRLAPDAPQSPLLRIAESLRDLSPRLAAFANAYQHEGQSEALGLRLGTSVDELSHRIRKGDISPAVNRVALDMGHGEDIARKDFEDIRQRYLGQSTTGTPAENNAFNRDADDLDGWFKTVVQEKQKALPPGEGVAYSWRKQMLGYQKQLYAEHDGYYTQRTKLANMDAAYKDVYGTAIGAVSTGERDPAKIHAAMREAHAKTGKLHLLTPAETDEAMAASAQAIADQGIPGNPMLAVDLVKEIFLGQRSGAPSLGSSPKYADVAVKTIERAQKTAGEQQRKLNLQTAVELRDAAHTGTLNEAEFSKFVEANPYIFSQSEKESIVLTNRNALRTAREKQGKIVETLAREAQAQASEQEVSLMLHKSGENGTLLTLPEKVSYLKKDGTTGTYGRDELIKRGVEEKLAEIEQWAKQTRDSNTADFPVEALKREREIAYFKMNPVKNPQWADILNHGFDSAAPDTLAGAQQAPPHLLQAVQLYEDLEAKTPGLLKRHLASKDAEDFYTTYRVARTMLHQDERQALITAAQATKSVADPTAYAPAYAAIERELPQPWAWLPWVQGITNYGEMTDDIRHLARTFVRAGASPTRALTRAGDEVRKQYVNINGYMVRAADRNIESWGANLAASKLQPRPFEATVKDYLTVYAGKGSAADKLSIRRMTDGTGAWAIVDAATGFPVSSDTGLSQVFSIADLIEFEKAHQAGTVEKKLKELRTQKSWAAHNVIRHWFDLEDFDPSAPDEGGGKPPVLWPPHEALRSVLTGPEQSGSEANDKKGETPKKQKSRAPHNILRRAFDADDLPDDGSKDAQ